MSSDFVIHFKEPYEFEGKKYEKVDLSGLNDLTAKDLIEADKIFISSGQVAAMNELSVGYTCLLASRASNLPVEFFEKLPAKEAVKVKNAVGNFLFE